MLVVVKNLFEQLVHTRVEVLVKGTLSYWPGTHENTVQGVHVNAFAMLENELALQLVH